MTARILFHVQHLLGIGHARRAALIARALADHGLEVTVAFGGLPVPGLDFGAARVVPLPAVRAADSRFKVLLDASGAPIDAAWKARRAAMLLRLFEELRPDVLLVETYPFGRRAFRFELEPLLDAAHRRPDRPLVAASVRDILVAKDDPARSAEMARVARVRFDLVLVHGDPRVIPFEATFPQAGAIADRIRYTGYVAAPRPARSAPGTDGTGEVVVSVGGGAVGLPLLQAALAARPLSPLAAAPWRLLAGPDLPEAEVRALGAAAPAGVTVERARPDFPALLARCALSISQAGYNTVMDLLQARCRAVLVPFAAGGETEQPTRARLLAARGLATVVAEATLGPDTLADGIRRALAAPPPPAFAIDLDGAAATARRIAEAVRARRAAAGAPP